MSAVSPNRQLKMILMPERHTLGWQILLPSCLSLLMAPGTEQFLQDKRVFKAPVNLEWKEE